MDGDGCTGKLKCVVDDGSLRTEMVDLGPQRGKGEQWHDDWRGSPPDWT